MHSFKFVRPNINKNLRAYLRKNEFTNVKLGLGYFVADAVGALSLSPRT